jgi:hypothetical protein
MTTFGGFILTQSPQRAASALSAAAQRCSAMRLRVPSDAPVGANGLFWELDPFGSHTPAAARQVTIDR